MEGLGGEDAGISDAGGEEIESARASRLRQIERAEEAAWAGRPWQVIEELDESGIESTYAVCGSWLRKHKAEGGVQSDAHPRSVFSLD